MNLVGHFLVATPLIDAGIFDHAVVLMIEHNEDGALGVIVNQPSEVPVVELLPRWDHGNALLYRGGPVGEESALAIASVDPEPTEMPGLRRFSPHFALVNLDGDPQELVDLHAMRTFVGYSGWSAGQLELELREESWFVVEAERADLLAAPDQLYSLLLRRAGGSMALHSTYLSDPTLN